MNVRDLIWLLEREGWRLARPRGSHRQFTHPSRPGVVTIAGKRSADLAVGTLKSIVKHAGVRLQ